MLGLNEGVSNHLSVMAPKADGNGEVMLVFPEGLHWREVSLNLTKRTLFLRSIRYDI